MLQTDAQAPTLIADVEHVRDQLAFMAAHLMLLQGRLDGRTRTTRHETLRLQNPDARRDLQHLVARMDDHALQRIGEGTYGICSVTREVIARERLDVVPHATTCVEAKRGRR